METIQPYVIGWLVPTVLAAITGYLGGQLRKVREYKRKMDDDRKTLDELTLMVCRMAIYDEHFTVDEKIDAYRIYKSKGGNHHTKKYMDELLGEDADLWLASH